MPVVGFAGHQEVGVVSHEPSDIGSSQSDRQTQEGELFIFGHREVGRHGSEVTFCPPRPLMAVLSNPTVESTRRAGFDIPPGEELAWAYQAAFKEKSRVTGIDVPTGILRSRHQCICKTQTGGNPLLDPLSLIGGSLLQNPTPPLRISVQ